MSARPGGWSLRSAYTLAVLTLIYTFNYVDRQILALVLPLLKKDLHLSDTSLGLISGFAFVLFYSLLGVPIARLADRSNRRNILAVGLTVWSLMTALTGAVTSIWQLAATRFLMGAGEASGVAPSNAMVSDIFDKASRPLALAILTSGTSLAALIFFPITGWISQTWGWRDAFYAAGVAGLVLALLLIFTVPEPKRTDRRKGPQEGFRTAMAFLAGSPAYVLTVIGGAFVGVSLYASQIWNPSFLVRVHHLSMVQVGASIGVVRGIMGLTGALVGGVLADRLGRRDERWRLWIPGLACMAVLPAELLFLLSPGLGPALVGLALASFFTSMHLGPVYAACQNLARPSMRATAAAVFLLFANLVGQVVGPLAVGWLNDYWRSAYGEAAIRYSLILGSGCAFLGGMLIASGAWRMARDTARAEADPDLSPALQKDPA